MEKKSKTSVKTLKKELEYYKKILDSIPAIIYVNELKQSGDISSFKNEWMNQRGYDFLECTREEIELIGFDFFKEMIHPVDLQHLSVGSKKICTLTPESDTTTILRIKSKIQGDYRWFFCTKAVLEIFDNGTMRKTLTVASEIKEMVDPDHQISLALKEILRQNNRLKELNITKREFDVLRQIAQGKTNDEIAKIFNISIHTAKKHRTHLIQKTCTKNSSGLAALAVESGEY